jgi:uncharacterized protein (TIGR02217 family)
MPIENRFRPWTTSRHIESAKAFSRINLDAAGRSAPFQPLISLVEGEEEYRGHPLFVGDTGTLFFYGEEFEYFKAFYNSRKGKLGTFDFKDFSDYSTTATPLLNCVDSNQFTQGVTYPPQTIPTTTEYQMFKKYGNIAYSLDDTYRRISRPIPASVVVYADSILVPSSQYSVNSNGGFIDFSTVPVGTITFDCEFDILARFDSDNYSAEVLMDEENQQYFKVAPIPLVEVVGERKVELALSCDAFLNQTPFLIPLNPFLNSSQNPFIYLLEGFINYGYSTYSIGSYPALHITNTTGDPFGTVNTSIRNSGFSDGFSNPPRFVFDAHNFVPGANWTLEFWFRPFVLPSQNSFLFDNRSSSGGFVMGLNENLRLSIRSQTSNTIVTSANNVVTLNQWMFISMTQSNLRVDGTSVINTPSDVMTNPGQYWNLGGSYYNFRSERVQADFCDFRVSNFDRGVYTKPLSRFPLVAC